MLAGTGKVVVGKIGIRGRGYRGVAEAFKEKVTDREKLGRGDAGKSGLSRRERSCQTYHNIAGEGNPGSLGKNVAAETRGVTHA